MLPSDLLPLFHLHTAVSFQILTASSLSSVSQIRALEKKKKSGKFAQKVKAKTRRRMHEMSNPLEQDEFADMWKE